LKAGWPEGPQGKDTVPFRRARQCREPFLFQPHPLRPRLRDHRDAIFPFTRHEQHCGIGFRDGEGEAEDIGVPPQHGGSDQPHHHQDGSDDGTQAGLEHAGHASPAVTEA